MESFIFFISGVVKQLNEQLFDMSTGLESESEYYINTLY